MGSETVLEMSAFSHIDSALDQTADNKPLSSLGVLQPGSANKMLFDIDDIPEPSRRSMQIAEPSDKNQDSQRTELNVFKQSSTPGQAPVTDRLDSQNRATT